MDKAAITAFFTRLDEELTDAALLYLYGSAVIILLDAPGRTSLDIDIAAPYSRVDQAALNAAAKRAGLPVNPESDYMAAHLEWVGPLRLCLPPPRNTHGELILWTGQHLTVASGSICDLVASKLIRYDEIDRGDVQYLFTQYRFQLSDVKTSIDNLPSPFNRDLLIQDNFENLKTDLNLWS